MGEIISIMIYMAIFILARMDLLLFVQLEIFHSIRPTKFVKPGTPRAKLTGSFFLVEPIRSRKLNVIFVNPFMLFDPF